MPPFEEGGPGAFAPAARSSDSGVVVDHPPHPFGGLAADTDFVNASGNPSWQLLADDFCLVCPAAIRPIRWYGFYGRVFGGLESPPASEAFRIRIHVSREGDGLPGDIILEEVHDDPLRTATGNIVFDDILRPEYLFETAYSAPIGLVADRTYWLSIVQPGDRSSHFRREFSRVDINSHVFQNPFVSDWTLSRLTSDAAFQLSTIPEPNTLGLAALGALWWAKRQPRR